MVTCCSASPKDRMRIKRNKLYFQQERYNLHILDFLITVFAMKGNQFFKKKKKRKEKEIVSHLLLGRKHQSG
jgi:hypothetical protein